MRKLILITILLVSLGGLQAQNKAIKPSNHQWRTEIASIFTGDSDLSGTSLYSEYSKYVSKRIKLAAGIGIQNFNGATISEFEYGPSLYNGDLIYKGQLMYVNADALYLGLSCYYDLIRIKKVNIELGLGFFIKNWEEISVNVNAQHEDGTVGYYKYADTNKTSFTPSISLGSQLYISNKISVNLRGFFQQGIENNSKPVVGIAGGITLKWNND